MLRALFVPVAFVALAGQAMAAELRPAITVTGAYVTLGDLFDDAGDAATVIVADAPVPGLTGEVSVSRISLAARRSGVEWRNASGLSHVVVARNGLSVPDADVATAISTAITQRNPTLIGNNTLQVDFTNGAAGLQVADNAPQTVAVEQIAFNPRTAQFEALVRAPANDMLTPLRRLSGRVYPVVDVPVLTHDMQPGDLVKAQDIDWIKMPTSRVSQNIITSQDHLLGMSPRRPVRQGEALRLSDLSAPVVVEKGGLVDVLYSTGSLSLSARGRALQAGAIGDVITVLNTTSNRTIQGVVEAPNVVRIDGAGSARAAALPASATKS
ncbi:MAG: flagellar basal body P-ring formation chaperone FlgA [Parvibaculum sp.]